MVDLVFLKILFTSYRHTYFNITMLLVSLVIAATGLSAVLIINQSAQQSYNNENEFLIPNVAYRIIAKDKNKPISKQDFAYIRKKGLSNVIPISQYRTYILKNGEKVIPSKVQFTGIDTVSLFPILFHMQSEQSITDNSLHQVGILGGRAIAHPTLVRFLGGSLSDVDLSSESLKNLSELDLIALNEPSLGNDLVLDIQDFFSIFPNADITQLFVINDKAFDKNLEQLNKIIPSHLKLEVIDNSSNNQELTSSFHLNLTAMALLMFAVCMFIVLNASNLLINNRMNWFKVCRQLGISRNIIFRFQLVEILIMGAIATIAGIVFSIQIVRLVSPTVQATLEGLSGQEIGFGSTSFLSLFIQVYTITAIGCLIALFAPLIKSNNTLASINHTQSPISRRNQIIIFSSSALVFFCLFLLLVNFTDSLLLLLVGSALLIFSGCCAMLACYPILLAAISNLIPNNYPLLSIASKQSVFLSGKTKIASCAFFIAVTSNIGMNFMVDSFRNATEMWLETRLASDYYLYYSGNIEFKTIETTNKLRITPRLDKLISYKQNQIQLFSYPTSPGFKEAMLFDKTIGTKQAWEMFESEQGILVNQQFANSLDYQLYDNLTLPHPSTEKPTKFMIVGIYYDYGNPYKQVLLPIHSFDKGRAISSVYAIELNGDSIDVLTSFFAEKRVSPDQFQIYKSADLLSLSMQTFDKTFLITDGLNIVTLLVASFSLACVIVVLMQDDRPHNMLIRSFGVSKVKTQLLGLYQYILLCIVGLIFATPFGVLLSWMLIFKINLQAFNWTYPLIVNMNAIIFIYLLSMLIVLCVVVIPFIQASKRTIIEDLRCIN